MASTRAESATLLAADIGGTKSELAIVPRQGNDIHFLYQRRYLNAEHSSIEEIIDHFLGECGLSPAYAVLAVAGVVSGERARLTNLPWLLDARMLENRFGLKKVLLLNDLTAVAGSIPRLSAGDLLELQEGEEQADEARGIIAPGTGLGEGMLLGTPGRLIARGSEGGHADFAPVNDEQQALLSWMRTTRGSPVSFEMLVAGPGIASLYAFCQSYHNMPETPEIAEALAQATDRIPVIVDGALGEHPCPLCRYVVELFLSILGGEAGNLALKLYARGGMYLGGGILPRLVGMVDFAGFLHAFNNKGAMADLMGRIPVRLILRRDAALFGAACLGLEEFSGK